MRAGHRPQFIDRVIKRDEKGGAVYPGRRINTASSKWRLDSIRGCKDFCSYVAQ